MLMLQFMELQKVLRPMCQVYGRQSNSQSSFPWKLKKISGIFVQVARCAQTTWNSKQQRMRYWSSLHWVTVLVLYYYPGTVVFLMQYCLWELECPLY